MRETDSIDDLVKEVTKTIKLAYGRGFEAGGGTMRASILQAATDLNIPTHGKVARSIRARASGSRSGWGAVGAAITAILTKEPNLTMAEVEQRGLALNNGIAARSYGNNLRRYKGTKYKRDEMDRWSLI